MQNIKPLATGKLKLNLLPRILIASSRDESIFSCCCQTFKLESLSGQQATLIFHSTTRPGDTSDIPGAINANHVPLLLHATTRTWTKAAIKNWCTTRALNVLDKGIKFTSDEKINTRGKKAHYECGQVRRSSKKYSMCYNYIDAALMIQDANWECVDHQCMSLDTIGELIDYLIKSNLKKNKSIYRQCMEAALGVYMNARNYRRSIGVLSTLPWICIGKSWKEGDYVFINDLGLLIANKDHFQEINVFEDKLIENIIAHHSLSLLCVLSSLLAQRGGCDILSYILFRGPLGRFYTEENQWQRASGYIVEMVLQKAFYCCQRDSAGQYYRLIRDMASDIMTKDIFDLDNDVYSHKSIIEMLSENFKRSITTNADGEVRTSPVFAMSPTSPHNSNLIRVFHRIIENVPHDTTSIYKSYYSIKTPIPYNHYEVSISECLHKCQKAAIVLSQIGNTWT